MPAGILAALVLCGPWSATSKPCESPFSLPDTFMRCLSTSACATSLACHPSVGHLAACVAQQGDSSGRVTLAWPKQGPQASSQGTTGSLQTTAGSCSPAILPNLRFALTPPPLPSLNFGLPYPIQHSTSRGLLSQSPSPPAPAASYHHLPDNNKVLPSRAGQESLPLSVRRNSILYDDIFFHLSQPSF